MPNQKTERKMPAVLLDIDDTLLDFHKAEAIALTKTLIEMGIEPKEQTLARYSQINAKQWELLEEGKLTREQVLTCRFDILFRELGIEHSGYEARLLYERYLSIGHFFMDWAEELLKALYGRYRLYIVSNGTASVQAGRIESAGIAEYFEEIFISEEIGHNKPSADFFECCFERIPDFDRALTIIVGDSLTSDIRGGINAEIKTCWYNPQRRPAGHDVQADYEICNLRQLPPLLERIFPA